MKVLDKQMNRKRGFTFTESIISTKGKSMNLTKDGWKLSELKTEKRQLNRQFKNAKRRHDILQMEAINYRLKIVEAQIDRYTLLTNYKK